MRTGITINKLKKDNVEAIFNGFEESGLRLDNGRASLLAWFMEDVLRENDKVNLTAITEPEEFVRSNIVDSASVIKTKQYQDASNVIDLGTGAGLPGMVLAILSPDKEFTLLDSVQKKLVLLERIAIELDLNNVNFVHARAEDAGHDPGLRERFDLCVTRAVAPMNVLSEFTIPFVVVGGYLIAYKGVRAREETTNARRAIDMLGGEILNIQDAGVSGTKHAFVIIKKRETTPARYPRKAGKPSAKPL